VQRAGASRRLRIGIVACRLGGTDGVSLEADAWSRVLHDLGHETWSFAGRAERRVERCTVEPLAFFGHPGVVAMTAALFGAQAPGRATRGAGPGDAGVVDAVEAMASRLRHRLLQFVRRADLQLLIAENTLSLPVHVPLGLALARLSAELAIPVLAHHHDLPWERDRFAITPHQDLLDEAFPPRQPRVFHVCINTQQRCELLRRVGVGARVIPNTVELDDVPVPPPELRAELGVAPGELMVLQPTRVIPRKGIEHALELVRRLGRPARLVITGAEGDEGHAYGRHVEVLGQLLGVDVVWAADRFAEHRGRRADGVPVYALDDAFAAADLVTYPSMVEGFGRAFLAAVRNRCLIVVNRYPVYDLDIRPLGFKVVEMDGFVTERTVVQALTALDDPATQARWAEHNLDLVRRHFSIPVLRRKLQAALSVIEPATRATVTSIPVAGRGATFPGRRASLVPPEPWPGR
jgi:glycosyltransferase involved in cell wall biosynthesis